VAAAGRQWEVQRRLMPALHDFPVSPRQGKAVLEPGVEPGRIAESSQLAPGDHQRLLTPSVIADTGSRYEQLVRITDHIAGMTDNYAVRLYRELRGMRYPGGRD